MPANDNIIPPKEGHIDLLDGLINCPVAVSVEFRERNGETVPMLHLDVGRGQEIEDPFSVGVALSPQDVQTLVSSLVGVHVPQSYVPPTHEGRLN